jgi:hypothetical protein
MHVAGEAASRSDLVLGVERPRYSFEIFQRGRYVVVMLVGTPLRFLL